MWPLAIATIWYIYGVHTLSIHFVTLSSLFMRIRMLLQNWFEPIVKYSKMFVCDLSNQISLGGQQQEQRGISPFFLWRVEKRIEILIEISLCHCRVHSVSTTMSTPHTILKHSVRIWYRIGASIDCRCLLTLSFLLYVPYFQASSYVLKCIIGRTEYKPKPCIASLDYTDYAVAGWQLICSQSLVV